jgi:chromosome segregation ATPase
VLAIPGCAESVTEYRREASYRAAEQKNRRRTATRQKPPAEQQKHSAEPMSDYVSTTEAANILECSDTLIRNRLRLGTLRGEKIRGKWMVLREDLAKQPRPHAAEQQNSRTAEDLDSSAERQNSRTAEQQNSLAEQQNGRTAEGTLHVEWRDDLLAQVARLEASEATLREDADRREQILREEVREVHHEAERRGAAAAEREQLSKARIIDLERELTVRDSRLSDLVGQNQVLEAKVREVLEKSQDEAMQLANRNADLADRIADLVAAHADMHARVVELQPVAERVPMLQAAVEEKDASLSERERALQDREQELGNMRQDIDAIASRPVTGPVFRLLTKGRLRR